MGRITASEMAERVVAARRAVAGLHIGLHQRLDAISPAAARQYRLNLQPFLEARQRATLDRQPLIDACIGDINAHWRRQLLLRAAADRMLLEVVA